MLPFLQMRLSKDDNNVEPFLEKMKKGQLVLENILEEDSIIEDLKLNQNSQFLQMLSHENIRKLIDYATKLPQSDDKKIGHKFPFNATELLCCDNCVITDRILNEIEVVEDSEEEEEDVENEDKENGEKDEEKFVEVKEDEEKQEKKKEEKFKKEEGIPNKDEKQIKEETKKENQDEEDSEREQPKIIIIYDNVDYLLQFLNSSEETKLNYVLVGYFCKILNHLFSYKSSIIQYLFDYPKKSEFILLIY